VIVLWGVPGDTPLAQVHRALARQGTPTVLADERAVLETEIDLVCGDTISGVLRVGNMTLDLSNVTAVYMRPYGVNHLPVLRNADQNSAEWRHAVSTIDALLAWVEVTPALVVNPPSAMATNDSKHYQARLIEAAGFAIPETLVTTDEYAARAFWEDHGSIIYKSVSGVRSIVSRLTPEHLQRLQFVRWCPTQFQEYIEGPDYRVHVIGEDVFACEIISQADDYRYAAGRGIAAEIRPCELPQEVADRCRQLAQSMALAVAGIDLRLEPKRGWYCFEVNPSPAFTYYQNATGQAIDEAIARLLVKASRTPTTGTQAGSQSRRSALGV
jgi:glutathione synthase/RimK-type ligase-like ATP-grasp enzyme